MEYEKIIERIASLYGATSDIELSKMLGMNQSAVGMWRTRRTVPPKTIRRISEEKGVSIEWIKFGTVTQEKYEASPTLSHLDTQGLRLLLSKIETELHVRMKDLEHRYAELARRENDMKDLEHRYAELAQRENDVQKREAVVAERERVVRERQEFIDRLVDKLADKVGGEM